MAEISRTDYVIEQDKFTDAELDDFTKLFNATLINTCMFADKHNFERNNILKYFAERLEYFADVATIEHFRWDGDN